MEPQFTRVSFRLPQQTVERFFRACNNRRVKSNDLLAHLIDNLNPDYIPFSYRTPGSQPDRMVERRRVCPKRYSDADQKKMLTEFQGGLKIEEIAQLWGCSRVTAYRVTARASTYGYPLSVPDPLLSVRACEEIRALHKSSPDLSYRKIGEQFGVSHHTIGCVLNKKKVYEWYGQPKTRKDSLSSDRSPRSITVSGYS